MKASVRLYKSDGAGEYGFPVKVIVSHLNKRSRKTIGYSELEDWDITSQLPLPSHDDFEDLYGTILEVKKKAARMEFRRLTDLEAAFEYLLNERDRKTYDFFAWAVQRIEYMEKHGRQGNAEAYRTAMNELQRFSPSLKFSEITPVFLERFKAYKRHEVKNSTIKNYLVEIRAMYNSAVKAGIIENTFPFRGALEDLPVQKRRQRNRYLPEEELKRLKSLSLDPSYQRAVDFSLLQFYLCGADLVDLYYLKTENLIGNRVFLSRRKLGAKAYEFDVLLPEEAQAIIEKYQAEKGEYVFPWRKDFEGYRTFRNNHNRNLKILQERLDIQLAPKNDSLTTKVMRHTFATLGKFARVEEDLLRELMGHERTDIDTVYKDKYPEKERDAAQLKIIRLY